jgi:hypothetical protein
VGLIRKAPSSQLRARRPALVTLLEERLLVPEVLPERRLGDKKVYEAQEDPQEKDPQEEEEEEELGEQRRLREGSSSQLHQESKRQRSRT